MILMTHRRHKGNVIYNKRSNSCQCPNSPNTAPATILVADETSFTPTSPNTAPATKNNSHVSSLSQMKRDLLCGEHYSSTTKYYSSTTPLLLLARTNCGALRPSSPILFHCRLTALMVWFTLRALARTWQLNESMDCLRTTRKEKVSSFHRGY